MNYGPVYSIPLVRNGDGEFVSEFSQKTAGAGMYPITLGTAYADKFKRDKAPSQGELISNLVGTAFRCANLNSNLVASARMRLYIRNKTGDGKAKFVQAAERCGRRVVKSVPVKRLRKIERHGARGKSALLDAVEEGDGSVDEVIDHPILDLLRNPENGITDAGLSSYDHRWITQCLLESLGRCYWYIADKNRLGQPTRLIMLRAHLVREMVDMSGKSYILNYMYGTSTIAVEDMIRFGTPDPANPHLGFLSPMRAAIEKVRLARADDAFITALIENGGYPAGVWSPKGDSEGGGIGAPEARRMKSAFRTAFAQAGVGGIFVSEIPGSLQALGFKPTEIVSKERHDQLIGEIADDFDIPRTKLFRDSANRASGESGDIDHARDAGISRCSRYEEALNMQLVPLFDDSGRLFLAFDSPVPSDMAEDLDELKAGDAVYAFTLNEKRARLGMDPEPGDMGDCRMIPTTMGIIKPDGTPLVEPEPPPAPIVPPGQHPPGGELPPGTQPPVKPPEVPPAPATPPPKKARSDKSIKALANAVMMMAGEIRGMAYRSTRGRGQMNRMGLCVEDDVYRKDNPNHDLETGEFSSGGGDGSLVKDPTVATITDGLGKSDGKSIIKYSDDQPRDDHGRFGAGDGGSGGGSSGGSRALNILEVPLHIEHAIIGKVKAGVGHAVNYVREIATGNLTPAAQAAEEAVKAPAGTVTKIGHGVAIVAKGGVKTYMTSWIAGNKAVELVARAKDFVKGLAESEVQRVKSVCAGYDVLLCKPVMFGLEMSGMGHAAVASTFVPIASACYLAHAAVTNPIAICKAAKAAVKAVKDKLTWGKAAASQDADVAKAAGLLCDAAKTHAGDENFFACLPEAIEMAGEHGKGIADAIDLAERAAKEMPAPKDE